LITNKATYKTIKKNIMEKSLKAIATNYGLYLGIVLSLITIAIYAVNLDLMVNMWLGIGILLVVIVFGIVSTIKAKTVQNGFINFKEALTAYVVATAIGIGISTVVSFIVFNFVDPEAAEYIKEKTIEVTVTMLEGFNTPSDAIAKAVEDIENQNQYAPLNLLKSFAFGMVLQIIIGLIVAAVMKKNHPDAE
jgi:putative flippase GtrA